MARRPTAPGDRHAASVRLVTASVLELRLVGRIEQPALRAALRTLESLRTAAPGARHLLIDGAAIGAIERDAADALASWLAGADRTFARCACVAGSAFVRMLFAAMLARTSYAEAASVFDSRDAGLAALEAPAR